MIQLSEWDYQKLMEQGITSFLENRGIEYKDLELRWLYEGDDDYLVSLIVWKPVRPIPEENWRTIDECEEPPLARLKFILVRRDKSIEDCIVDLIELMNRIRYGAFKETQDHGPDPVWDERIALDNEFDVTSCWHYSKLDWDQFGDPYLGYHVEMLVGLCYCS